MQLEALTSSNMAIQKEWNMNVPHCGQTNKSSSIFILVINQLDAQNFYFTISLFHASTCFEPHVLIIRRSKLHYTASGIITPIGGRPTHRLREDWLCLMIPEAV